MRQVAERAPRARPPSWHWPLPLLPSRAVTTDSTHASGQAIHEYYAHHVDNADAKAGAILSLDIALGALILANLPRDPTAHAFSWLAVACDIVALAAGLWAIFPRLPSSGSSLILWEDVRRRPSAEDYADALTNLSADAAAREWAENAFHIAGVLHRKFAAIQVALAFTAAGLITAGLSLVFR